MATSTVASTARAANSSSFSLPPRQAAPGPQPPAAPTSASPQPAPSTALRPNNHNKAAPHTPAPVPLFPPPYAAALPAVAKATGICRASLVACQRPTEPRASATGPRHLRDAPATACRVQFVFFRCTKCTNCPVRLRRNVAHSGRPRRAIRQIFAHKANSIRHFPTQFFHFGRLCSAGTGARAEIGQAKRASPANAARIFFSMHKVHKNPMRHSAPRLRSPDKIRHFPTLFQIPRTAVPRPVQPGRGRQTRISTANKAPTVDWLRSAQKRPAMLSSW